MNCTFWINIDHSLKMTKCRTGAGTWGTKGPASFLKVTWDWVCWKKNKDSKVLANKAYWAKLLLHYQLMLVIERWGWGDEREKWSEKRESLSYSSIKHIRRQLCIIVWFVTDFCSFGEINNCYGMMSRLGIEFFWSNMTHTR